MENIPHVPNLYIITGTPNMAYKESAFPHILLVQSFVQAKGLLEQGHDIVIMSNIIPSLSSFNFPLAIHTHYFDQMEIGDG